MAGSYDRRRVRVRHRLATLAGAACGFLVAGAAAPPNVRSVHADQAPNSGIVLLQLRVFDGTEDVTKESRILLYPRGQRTGEIAVTLGADQAFEAPVTPGFYDIQAIRERRGQVIGIRWIEQVLVQRYPDEYGRHLQVLNLKSTFGALQIRPAPDEPGPARGWSASVHPPGDPTREVGKARPIGTDLLVVLPAGRYDIRVTLNDGSSTWMRDVDIPTERTRLKTWSAPSGTP